VVDPVRPLRTLTKRVALGVTAAWAVLTAVFALFGLTGNWALQWRVALLRWAGTEEHVVESVREEYLAVRGLDRPLVVQYVD